MYSQSMLIDVTANEVSISDVGTVAYKPVRFLIINHTESAIKVSFSSQNLSGKIGVFKIPAECSRVIGDCATDKIYILSEETMEEGVEVQCLR